jgi:aminotransferase EvaB
MIFVGDPRPRAARRLADLERCFQQFLLDGQYVLGSGVTGFEEAFSGYTRIPHCIGVANGTDALELALRSLGVGPGDGVATVANAGGYSSCAIHAIGATPVFMDVDAQSFCVTLATLQAVLSSQLKAVIVTHLYGRIVPEIAAIVAFCREHKILLIEDCAQSHGARWQGQHAGSFADASCFSFYPTKNLGALGDGGAVCTANLETAERCRQLRQYGWARKYHCQLAGGRNSRLDELQARILLLFLQDLDAENCRRIHVAARYRQLVHHPKLILPPPPEDPSSHVYHLFVVQVVAGRDDLLRHLRSQGVMADVHYPVPDYEQPIFESTIPKAFCPVTDYLAAHSLSLPCYPDLEPQDQDQVTTAIMSWVPEG